MAITCVQLIHVMTIKEINKVMRTLKEEKMPCKKKGKKGGK